MMLTRKFSIYCAFVLMTGVLFVRPGNVEAQCNVVGTPMSTVGMTIFVTKTLMTAAACHSTAMNAGSCFPNMATMTVTKLFAVAMTATMGPYCNWSCACGTGAPPHVTITGADGLPVELMDFKVSSLASVPRS